jgi:hypothetical protein
MAATPHSVLQKYWGYGSFRDQQEEAVNACLAGRDCLIVLATGSGKSVWCVPASVVCMAGSMPACVFAHLCVRVSRVLVVGTLSRCLVLVRRHTAIRCRHW